MRKCRRGAGKNGSSHSKARESKLNGCCHNCPNHNPIRNDRNIFVVPRFREEEVSDEENDPNRKISDSDFLNLSDRFAVGMDRAAASALRQDTIASFSE